MCKKYLVYLLVFVSPSVFAANAPWIDRLYEEFAEVAQENDDVQDLDVNQDLKAPHDQNPMQEQYVHLPEPNVQYEKQPLTPNRGRGFGPGRGRGNRGAPMIRPTPQADNTVVQEVPGIPQNEHFYPQKFEQLGSIERIPQIKEEPNRNQFVRGFGPGRGRGGPQTTAGGLAQNQRPSGEANMHHLERNPNQPFVRSFGPGRGRGGPQTTAGGLTQNQRPSGEANMHHLERNPNQPFVRGFGPGRGRGNRGTPMMHPAPQPDHNVVQEVPVITQNEYYQPQNSEQREPVETIQAAPYPQIEVEPIHQQKYSSQPSSEEKKILSQAHVTQMVTVWKGTMGFNRPGQLGPDGDYKDFGKNLAKMLEHEKKFHTLHIMDTNYLTMSYAVGHFAQSLKMYPNLHKIILQGTTLTREVLRVFVKALQENTSVKELVLEFTGFEYNWAIMLAELLDSNIALTDIKLQANFGDRGVASLMSGLKHNHTFKRIEQAPDAPANQVPISLTITSTTPLEEDYKYYKNIYEFDQIRAVIRVKSPQIGDFPGINWSFPKNRNKKSLDKTKKSFLSGLL